MLTAILLNGSGFGGTVEDIKKCVAYPSRQCTGTLDDLLRITPDRDVVKSLSMLVLAKEWYFTMNSLSVPYMLSAALRHHAPADRTLAASAFSRAILDDTFGAPVDDLIKGLVENLSTKTPQDIRARAILALTALADDSSSQWQPEAQEALKKVAHLTAAPEPPVVVPPGTEPPPVTPIVFPGAGPRKKMPGAMIAGLIGVVGFAALATVVAVKRRS
jgi:hypothetical protein